MKEGTAVYFVDIVVVVALQKPEDSLQIAVAVSVDVLAFDWAFVAAVFVIAFQHEIWLGEILFTVVAWKRMKIRQY